MKKKKVGIYAYSLGENSFGVGKQYLEFASKFGSPKILLSDEIFRNDIDLLLLVGGADLNPNSYGQNPGFFTSNIDVHKQYVYERCLSNYVGNGVPIFGICLGMQQLNCYFGGSMTQDLPYHKQSKIDYEEGHKATIENGFKFSNKKGNIGVTSTHHQAILRNQLSESLLPVLYAQNEEYVDSKVPTEMDIIEGFMHVGERIAGVQSHPERLCDPYIFDLINHIIR